MTDIEKQRILNLRLRGFDYAAISHEIQIKPETVRSYCRKVNLTEISKAESTSCLFCGKQISQPNRGIIKLYCSERCRSAWRRSTKTMNEKIYHHIYQGCGKEFDTITNKVQKYCSRTCYQKSRKGGAS